MAVRAIAVLLATALASRATCQITEVERSTDGYVGAESNYAILVAGWVSLNVVKFNVATGQSTVFAQGLLDAPRGIAVDGEGTIYVSLQGGAQNIVKLVPTKDGDFTPLSFTDSVPPFGSPQIDFHQSGDLFAAGGGQDLILRFDGVTGELVTTYMHSGCCNIVGLMVNADFVYATEFFSNQILRFDLSQDPVTSEVFVPADPDNLAKPIGMTIGHNGNLFVASTESSLLQEFDGETGEFLGTWADLAAFGETAAIDIHYVNALSSYFVTPGPLAGPINRVLRLDTAGGMLTTYESAALTAPYGVTVVQECLADLDGDGMVGTGDFLLVLAQWGPCPPDCIADVDGDGTVGVLDFLTVLAEWGPCE